MNKKERTRELILNTSYKLFAKRGFNQVTMKDICEATGLSRGGLYSHFAGTKEIFEAVLKKLKQKDVFDFAREMAQGTSAIKILDNALSILREEMLNPENSLSLALYEYAGSVGSDVVKQSNEESEKRWSNLILYGIERGEFSEVNAREITNILLYSYQGVRMWSCIIDITPETCESIIFHIRKQLVKEENEYAH